MLKICNECGKEYETDQPRKRLCEDCIKFRRLRERIKRQEVYKTKNALPKPKAKKQKPVFSINDIVKFIDNYYQSHNVKLSYGEAVMLIEKEYI